MIYQELRVTSILQNEIYYQKEHVSGRLIFKTLLLLWILSLPDSGNSGFFQKVNLLNYLLNKLHPK